MRGESYRAADDRLMQSYALLLDHYRRVVGALRGKDGFAPLIYSLEPIIFLTIFF